MVVVTKRRGCSPRRFAAPHQPRHTFLADAAVVVIGQLRMNARRTVGAVRAPMDRMDEGRQPDIRHGPRRQGPLQPGIESAGGDAQQPAHHPNRKGGLIRFHEPEDRFVFGAVSCANQAAAFDKMSRSTFSCRFSRRSRVSSVRSAVVRPAVRRPASRSAWATQLLIDCAVGSNSPARSSGVRPARTNATSCSRNSGGYGLLVLGIVDSFYHKG